MEIIDDKTAKFEPGDQLAGLPEEVQNAQIGPMQAISTIALNMAMKYHDITTVHDGTLYQQFKLEGRNMQCLQLAEVFHTAVQIEEHLIKANRRVAQMMVLACLPDDEESAAQDQAEPDEDAPEPPAEPASE